MRLEFSGGFFGLFWAPQSLSFHISPPLSSPSLVLLEVSSALRLTLPQASFSPFPTPFFQGSERLYFHCPFDPELFTIAPVGLSGIRLSGSSTNSGGSSGDFFSGELSGVLA